MEHIALYRRFRPMTFDEIVEQQHAVSSLRQAVISDKIGHAYLFCGTRGTGKTTIAKVFSRAVNCENPVNGNPCNKCEICRGILNGSLMDVIEIDAASNNSVDNIRRICEEVVFAPSKARFKVYIIDEVHMLSQGAFNALLKTLEEPPQHAVFLLATTEPHRIPPTILSRCQRYDFRRISLNSISGRLKAIAAEEGFNITDDAVAMIASLADGAMRDAISLLDQTCNSANGSRITRDTVAAITGTADDEFFYKMAEILINGDYEGLLPLCEEVSAEGRDLIRFLLDLSAYFRDLLVIRMMPDPTRLVRRSFASLEQMYRLASGTNSETLVAFISYLSKTISELKWSPAVRTSFEISLLRLCGRKVKAESIPLVIPDFSTKQAAAAAVLSEASSSAHESAHEVEIVTEPEVEPEAGYFGVPEPQENSEPSDEYEYDEAPMENQIDIFSAAEAEDEPSVPVAKPPVIPSAEIGKDDVSDNLRNRLADFLPSFLNDISTPPPEAQVISPSATLASAPVQEKQRSALATAMDGTSLIVKKTSPAPVRKPSFNSSPADLSAIWNTLTDKLADTDYALSLVCAAAKLLLDGDGAYIVFEDGDVNLIHQLTSDSGYKKISEDVISVLPEAKHVFACTSSGYARRGTDKTALGRISDADDRKKKLDSFIRHSEGLGVQTEIHFGDD